MGMWLTLQVKMTKKKRLPEPKETNFAMELREISMVSEFQFFRSCFNFFSYPYKSSSEHF